MRRGNRLCHRSVAAGVGLLMALQAGPGILPAQEGAEPDLSRALERREEGNRAAAESQARVGAVADETEELVNEYRTTLRQIDSLRAYARQVEGLLAAQQKEEESLQRQIDGVTALGREITPLMLRMIDALEAFVRLDVPFLPEERTMRIQQLKELMGRSDVSESEKYRRVLEAYQAENEYGRTIEAYQGTLDKDGKTRTVDFLRVGRIALLYRTMDGNEVGVWHGKKKIWMALGDEYRAPVRQGLNIARKQAAPDLVELPVLGAEAVR